MVCYSSAVRRTLAYADVFDYPLTADEIKRYLIAPVNESRLPSKPQYFFLPGRQKIVDLRHRRERASLLKNKYAAQVTQHLKIIPSIKLIGITGALAMNNTNREDDIDLLIITSQNRLWLTRFFTVLLTELLGVRRRPSVKQVRNKICLNLFLDENNLAIPVRERNLFLAHEVCQMKPIWDKDNTYQRFIIANLWTKKYLPNWTPEIVSNLPAGRQGVQIRQPADAVSELLIIVCRFAFIFCNFDFVENLARLLQLRYMRSRRTIEKINSGRLMFHPHDCRKWILTEYRKRLQKYLLDKDVTLSIK
jgi:hypothetical protein